MKRLFFLPVLFFASVVYNAQAQILTDGFPAESQPLAVGRRVSERFLSRPFFNYGKAGEPRLIFYPEACAWYGAITFARLSGDIALQRRLAARYEPLLGARDTLVPPADHVDHSVIGAIPLALYTQTKDTRYLATGKKMADGQWTLPEGKKLNITTNEYVEKGYSWQTRLWIDDMFMINLLQVQAYVATGNRVYIDRAAHEMVMYLDSLQQNNGLFFHAKDVPFFWGRGNGWMAAGMTILLDALPRDHPDRPRILSGYIAMMSSLIRYQSADGMWRQLVDDSDSWEESSGTAMFTYALIMGAKRKWLDTKACLQAALKGWLALVARLDANADLTGICEGTNKKNDHQYYINRKQLTGDLHGQAPLLWCAAAWLER